MFFIFALNLLLPQSYALTVYTDRPQALLQQAQKAFEQSGQEKITFVEQSAGDILSRLDKEGSTTPADVVLVNDLVFMEQLARQQKLQTLKASPALNKVPQFMRDSAQRWVSLAFRVRTAAYDPARVAAKDLTTYEDLASDKWAGRLCVRVGSHPYNQALVSHLIGAYGEAKTRQIVKGWLNNLAVEPFKSDNAILEAITKGTCEVGLVNHYYWNIQKSQNPNYPVALAYLDQGQGQAGTHANGTAVGIVASSKNAAQAQRFIEVLLEQGPQSELANGLFVYPSTIDQRTIGFRVSPQSWSKLGEQLEQARQLMKDVGYN